MVISVSIVGCIELTLRKHLREDDLKLIDNRVLRLSLGGKPNAKKAVFTPCHVHDCL